MFGHTVDFIRAKSAPSRFVPVLYGISMRTGHATIYVGCRVSVCEYEPWVLHVPMYQYCTETVFTPGTLPQVWGADRCLRERIWGWGRGGYVCFSRRYNIRDTLEKLTHSGWSKDICSPSLLYHLYCALHILATRGYCHCIQVFFYR
jgi:hypothetical protein